MYGKRTLLLFFYAGRGATINGESYALLNSNQTSEFGREYQFHLKMHSRLMEIGAYIILLLACDRLPIPEEVKEEAKGTAPG